MRNVATTDHADTDHADADLLHVRVATSDDAETVQWLDDLAFPLDDPDLQPADPGEIQAGIDAGDMQVLEVKDQVIGYIHLDESLPDRLYIRAMGIHPDVQRNGYGSHLFDTAITSSDAYRDLSKPIVTVTSPSNVTMLHMLFARGFAMRWALPDFFGVGRDRFGFQLRTDQAGPTAGRSRIVPIDDFSAVAHWSIDHGEVGRALVDTPAGPALDLAPAAPGEFLACSSPRDYYAAGPA